MRLPTLLTGILATLLIGCTYERVVHDGWAGLRKLADSQQQGPSAGSDAPAQPGPSTTQWAIHVLSFKGPARRRHAQSLIDQLKKQANLPDLWMNDDADQVHVYRGRYDDPASTTAQNDLRQTRMVKLDGEPAYQNAQLVPLGPAAAMATADPLDLRQHTGMYSLQIGYYDEAFGPEFRQAAEQAAKTLRGQGDPAFYCHGPTRSMVTIGLFTDADFGRDGAVWIYGPAIKALQEKYPYNLGNGRTLIQKVNGQQAGEQQSFLVRVP